MSGRPRSAAITAPEMPDAVEALLLDQPGGQRVERAREDEQAAAGEPRRGRRRASVRRECVSRACRLLQKMPGGVIAGKAPHGEAGSSSALSSGSRCATSRNRSISASGEHAIREGPELADVAESRANGRAPNGCGVGDGDLVDDAAAVGEFELDASAERLLGRVERVVAAGPLRVLGGGDLVPELDGVGATGARRA